ncbi:MAG: GNAT family N-acetyltransferase [Myxococcota bacterium]|nr:GNAT family N-acetyltransferase [Myxococcota bacterium]
MFTKIVAPPPHLCVQKGAQQLHLIRSRPAHAAQLLEGLHASLPELRAFMPWAHFENTLETQRARLGELEAKWDARGEFVWNLFLTESSDERAFVGCIGMHLNGLAESTVELGYWVRSEVAGQGVCTLATRAILYVAFEHQGLRRVMVTCDTNNEGSRRVIEKVGFPFEARLRNGGYFDAPAAAIEAGWRVEGDLFLYAMTPEDYHTQPWIPALRAAISFSDAQTYDEVLFRCPCARSACSA